ncbi:MAG: glycerol-3-phosphate 1-O-acyltransferase [Actinobacteria bacterium]|nr:MAG: glycerol-3-phosphate 1-O-acyltransferase [Actinomycetota bacterium]
MYLGLLIIAAAYLIGSMPIGLVVGLAFYGVDIREYGSGNLGATNAYRTLGPVGGIVVFAGDVAKGALPVLAAVALVAPEPATLRSALLVLTGLAAIAGHNWSLYLRFRGGKGVSTAAGVLLVLFPFITAILFAIWVAVLVATRYVSLASMAIALTFPALVVILYHGNAIYVGFSLIASAVVLFKHRSNIGRLIGGTEPKIWSAKPGER